MSAQSGFSSSDAAYVFISYAHVDRQIVQPYVLSLKQHNLRLWWDASLAPGAQWVRAVADAIVGCSAFLLLATRGVADSEYCFRETLFAQDHRIPTVVSYLESVRLPNRLSFLLSPIPQFVDGNCECDGVVEALNRTLSLPRSRRPRESNETDPLGRRLRDLPAIVHSGFSLRGDVSRPPLLEFDPLPWSGRLALPDV